MGKQEWGRRYDDNRPYPKTREKGFLPSTVFEKQPRYLSEILKLDTPENAEKSVKKLMKHFNEAQTHAKKLRVRRAALVSRNRAIVMLQNENYSMKEREEAEGVADIYDAAYKKMRIRKYVQRGTGEEMQRQEFTRR